MAYLYFMSSVRVERRRVLIIVLYWKKKIITGKQNNIYCWHTNVDTNNTTSIVSVLLFKLESWPTIHYSYFSTACHICCENDVFLI